MDSTAVDTEVIVIGSGFAGLGLAVALQREGRRDYLVLERASDVGGTWRDNTYPGAACDIQSHLYSYSFRPNPRWSRVYATQPEILEYLRATASEEAVLPRIRFDTEVIDATWHEDDAVWVVTTTRGVLRSRALVSASGHLSDPSYPDIPGLEDFAGEVFHSARWRHDVELAGRRIGVIGTGASAIQIVPELQRTAESLSVFQRSAPYLVPRRDYEYSEAEKSMFARLPETAQALRDELFWGNENRFPQRRQVPAFIEHIAATAAAHLEGQVEDPALRERLTPSYEIGCKRILISNEYYPALTQPNVELVTDGIARITPTGVRLRSGVEIELDVLVVATGFEATDLPIAERIHGRDGQLLSDRWADGGRAFACTAVAGFPNLFVMLGPNTGLGAGSIIFMVETQIEYIRQGVNELLERSLVAEPDERREDDYVRSIHDRSRGTVWVEGGCKSWYLHPRSGELTTLWPDFMSRFREENGTFRIDAYDVRPREDALTV